MKRNYHLLRSWLAVFMSFVFIFSFLEVCLAEKPRYKAKYEQNKNEAEINLNFTLPEYELNEEGEWMLLSCRNNDAALFLEKGEPELLSFTYFISIPEGTQVKKITVKPYTKKIQLAKPIKPVPEPVIIGAPPKPLVPDEKIYNSPQPYPAKDFDYEIAKQGSTTMLVLTIYPFKYIGKHQTLIVYEYIEVDIVLKVKGWKPNPKPRNAVDKNLKMRLVNPEDAFFQGGAQ